MQNSETKFIPFAKLFEIAAIRIFRDPSLLAFIPDKNDATVRPDIVRKTAQEAAVRHSLAHSEHAEIAELLGKELAPAARTQLESRSNKLQEQIRAELQDLKPEPVLRDYEELFEKRKRAALVRATLLNAHAVGKIALYLNSDTELPPDVFARATGTRFVPRESVIKFEVDSETRAGFVMGAEKEFTEWLIDEYAVADDFDTPEKRERRCVKLYEARILDKKTSAFSQDKHFVAIKAEIPSLRRKEFDSAHRELRLKYPHIGKGGRRKKTPSET